MKKNYEVTVIVVKTIVVPVSANNEDEAADIAVEKWADNPLWVTTEELDDIAEIEEV